MYIVRDIFHLKFGHYRDAKVLMDEARAKNMFPQAKSFRMLTDFTGDSYRFILEEGYDSLGEFEQAITSGMEHPDFKLWYPKFREHVTSSHREILKVIM
ncbi:MAG: hypothetical protein EPN92_03300 [Chitinophagaceae bacterium]|nr:MAG: hypothetical protein EPN92_03300 [Chitinophagaceae bacterium]